MKTEQFENREQWLEARKGKITGTRLKDIVVKKGTGKKLGYYELIAERLSVTEDEFEGYVPNETPMDRGTRLQTYAVDRFKKETSKKVDESIVMWSREDVPSIAISPDGVISSTEAIECKCLSSSRHLEAFLTQCVPDEYELQTIQYFIVNNKLKKLYVVFYDPRIPAVDYFVLLIERKNIESEIEFYLNYQKNILLEVEAVVKNLTF